MISFDKFFKAKKLIFYFTIFCITLAQSIANAAEVFAVDPLEKCFLCSETPSMTMYWKGADSKVALLLIPGGTGSMNITAKTNDLRQPFIENLKRLTDKDLTRGQIDLIVLDSPLALTTNGADLSGRATNEHMIRIESAVNFYKNKTGLPVWIIGQSNGGASLANFSVYMQEKGRDKPVAGAIASAVRPESRFSKSLDFPILFITNQLDGCRNISQMYALYKEVERSNADITKWVAIDGGEAEPGKDPCRSGFHMFFGAGNQYAKAIDDFIASSLNALR